MATAKDLRVAPISSQDANALVQRVHYSGKVVRNSQLHLGVFLGDRLEGAMQFGPSMDKRNILPLVEGTLWNGFLELNRMAFSDRLPRNSESRALGVAMRMIRKHYPHVEWIVSFADGTQCGDGTIYRASGFLLTGITKNKSIWIAPNVETYADLALKTGKLAEQKALLTVSKTTITKGKHALRNGSAGMSHWREMGFRPLEGFQLRYVYFLNPQARERLTVPVLPFDRIEQIGAAMYRGTRRSKQAMTGDHPEQRQGSADPNAPTYEAA